MKNIAIVLIFVFCFFSSGDKVPIAGFEIEVVSMFPEIQLRALKGCNWKTLSFTAKPFEKFVIDPSGVSFLKAPYSKVFNTSSFAFQASRNKNGLKMKSLKGTVWKELAFERRPFRKMTIYEVGVRQK